MKIVQEKPPVYDMIINAGMKPTLSTVYTYGDTIYVPRGSLNLEDHLIEHEQTHSVQQMLYKDPSNLMEGPDAWWSRYVDDVYFRIDQEAEAYGHQFTFICKRVKDRNMRNKILIDLGRFLASPIYGSVVTQDTARRMILNKSNVR